MCGNGIWTRSTKESIKEGEGMEYKESITLATIIRGLFLNVAGYPWIVAYERGGKAAPNEALVVDIDSALKDGVLDEEAASKVFLEAYTAWEFDKAPSGIEAAMMHERVKKVPSCIVVRQAAPGDNEVFYWIDRDIDAARKRMSLSLASVLEEKQPSLIAPVAPPKLDAVTRANVVNHKIALVVGEMRDTAAIARSLACSGALVFIADAAPSQDAVRQLADDINASSKRTAAIPLQVTCTDERSVEALFNTIAESVGGLDVCICYENVSWQGNVLEQSLEEFCSHEATFFLMVKYAGILLRRQARTAPAWRTDIIHVNPRRPGEKLERFDAQGLIGNFVYGLAAYNIKVNAICPGNSFDHPFWADSETGLFAQEFRAGKIPGAKSLAEVKTFYEARIPLKRACTALDVMRAIFYVIEQDYETGRVLPVSGGQA
jgi:sorbitol-6-phosphate 2-dehydrogenase